MKQILWFRRDLRITDSAILHYAQEEVLPIFIFDKHILDTLPLDDKRVTFIYESVLSLKKQLQSINLDLAIFYGKPKDIFNDLKNDYEEVLCSCDFDSYAIQRDNEIEKLISMKRQYDCYLIHPSYGLKKDGTPYKVFTPFYKNLMPLWESQSIVEYTRPLNLTLAKHNYQYIPTLDDMGFEKQKLVKFLDKSTDELLCSFIQKLDNYQEARDYFNLQGTSNLAVHLRFGLISPKQVFNKIKKYPNSQFFVRELFWREFYSYISYFFPKSEFENFNNKQLKWSENEETFQAWCTGTTGIPIIDAAMKELNRSGLMHNRLRMVVASFLTKNLFLPWQWGEKYFAQKLLDYDASSNIGSWQWGASTGADSAPYFRVFNPYAQSFKFDKEGLFIKSILKELEDVDAKLLHKENGVQSNLMVNYPLAIVDIKLSRQEAINQFKYSN